MLDEQNVGALMHEEASEAPESTVDVGRAVRVGRRRRRVRLAASGSVAALTVLAVGGGVAAVHGLARTGGPDQRLRSAQTAAPAHLAAPTAFNPLVRTVGTGYLPAGLAEQTVSIGTTLQALRYLHQGRADSSGTQVPDREVDVYVFTPGAHYDDTLWWLRKGARPPALSSTPSASATAASPSATPARPSATTSPATASPTPSGDPASGETGPTIAGGPSYWQENKSDTADDATLAWRWATGAWAFVRVSGYGRSDAARPVAAKVASSVRTGLREPVALPFAMRRPPAQLPLRQSNVTWNGTTFAADLVFARDADRSTNEKMLEGLLVSSQPTPSGQPEPNTTVGGHQAYISGNADFGRVDVYGVSGQQLSVQVDGAVTAHYVNLKQAMVLAATMTAVPGATNRATWTTDPLR